MQSYVPQEPRSLFGAAAFALAVLTMATLVVGPALLAQRDAPTATPDVSRSAPAEREIAIAPRMEVVLERAAYVETARAPGTAHRRGQRG